ncbi:MAG: hypothetical protein M3Y21_08295 [Candidatus Eremiobacteraeota bacterium]|nr:hypothetical protein [Candidatus Eremiobacteraeota bacterium]
MLSSNLYLVLVGIFALGAILFGIGGALKRRTSKITWPRLLDGDDADYDLAARIDMIERLGIVGEDWCDAILAQAALEEHDRDALAAIMCARSATY